ncbi:hypothetical protein BLNAU_13187 [Blattamonas nauphoetae]|uniref:Uncharacterized protein n=1 Tax=Blattamonas nauphoetae TaxID=2049346 RepID=A0ABQ9XLX7_9EUKA|nr:hypothetical protein BLNAU_13187 [Blattamonas nauphoetae]
MDLNSNDQSEQNTREISVLTQNLRLVEAKQEQSVSLAHVKQLISQSRNSSLESSITVLQNAVDELDNEVRHLKSTTKQPTIIPTLSNFVTHDELDLLLNSTHEQSIVRNEGLLQQYCDSLNDCEDRLISNQTQISQIKARQIEIEQKSQVLVETVSQIQERTMNEVTVDIARTKQSLEQSEVRLIEMVHNSVKDAMMKINHRIDDEATRLSRRLLELSDPSLKLSSDSRAQPNLTPYLQQLRETEGTMKVIETHTLQMKAQVEALERQIRDKNKEVQALLATAEQKHRVEERNNETFRLTFDSRLNALTDRMNELTVEKSTMENIRLELKAARETENSLRAALVRECDERFETIQQSCLAYIAAKVDTFLQATRVVVTADEKESASQTPDLMETLTISERLDIQTHQESFDCEYNYDESGLVHFRALPGAPTLPKEFTIVRSKKNKKGVIHPTQQTAQPIRSLTDQYPRYMEHYYSEFDKLAPQLLNGDQRQRPEDLGEEVELISYPLFSQPS